MVWMRYITCLLIGYITVVAFAYQVDFNDGQIQQFVKRAPELEAAAYPSDLWELDNAVRLKKWATQLRFGKRSNSWASAVRFG